MLRRETGSLLEDVDEVFSRVAESLVEGKVLSVIRPAKNGRLVRIASEPLESGGWVATHEDVTERQRLLAVRERAETLARENRPSSTLRSITWLTASASTTPRAASSCSTAAIAS